MTQNRSRQITRLEKRAVPRREGIEEQWRHIRQGAIQHATFLALLVRYGNPRLGEPLSCACARVAESELWVMLHQKFPPDSMLPDFRYPFHPYTRDAVTVLGDKLRHISIAIFPGANEKEKLNSALQSAPPWLVWFTFADFSAKLLGLSVPDLSTVSRFERSTEIFQGWWGFPQSAYECRPWRRGLDDEPLARTDLNLFELETGEEIARRKRTRALAHASRSNLSREAEWPTPIPEAFLRLDFRSQMRLLAKWGVPGYAEHGEAPIRWRL